MWRNPDAVGGKTSAPTLHQSGVMLNIVAPGATGLQLLADLGTERANLLAELPADADVTEGDELHIGATIYQIERAVVHATMTLCAIWELKPST